MTCVKAESKVILRYESTDNGKLKGGADIGGLFGDATERHTFMKVSMSLSRNSIACEKCDPADMINSVLSKENSPTFEFKGGQAEIVAGATCEKVPNDTKIFVHVSDSAKELFDSMLVKDAEIIAICNLNILTMKASRVEHALVIPFLKKWQEAHEK